MRLTTQLLAFGTAVVIAAPALAASEVNVYSARKDHLFRPIVEKFTEETGIKVNLLSATDDQLVERMKAEGANSPADILITTDVARLSRAKALGLLAPVLTPTLTTNVPAKYHDPEGYWYGLSARARVIFVNDSVKPGEVKTYKELADPKWKGRVCMRSSTSVYNQSLLASVIVHDGEEAALAWSKGLVDNFARKPQGGDREQIKAVASGVCDIAVANTYYYGGMIASADASDREAAAKVTLIYPDQDGNGTHMNVSGGGLASSSKHKDEAIKLLEFLSGPVAQKMYAEANNEFTVNPDIEQSAVVKSRGQFKVETNTIAVLGDKNATAIRIADQAGWR